MTDLTSILLDARRRGGFGLDAFEELLGRLRHALQLRWDWDSGVPENWATFFDGDDPVLLVWREGHFAFVRGRDAERIARALDAETILHVTRDDWDAPAFSLDPRGWEELFPDRSPADLDIDIAALSVNDLWWATVT